MLEREQADAAKLELDREEAESSVGRMTSRLDSKSMKNTKGGHETFNILPQPSRKESVKQRHGGTTMVETQQSDNIQQRP